MAREEFSNTGGLELVEKLFRAGTGLSLCFRPRGATLMCAGESDFCSFVQDLPMGLDMCRSSETVDSAGDVRVIECPMGIRRFVMPVSRDSEAGFLVSDGFLVSPVDEKRISSTVKKLEALGLDAEKARGLYARVPVISAQTLDRVRELMGVAAGLVTNELRAESIEKTYEEEAARHEELLVRTEVAEKSCEASLHEVKWLRKQLMTGNAEAEHSGPSCDDSTRHRKLAEEAIEFIDHNFAEDITVNDVADHINLSASYTSAILRQEYGFTFIQYVVRRRIQEACRLLRDSHLNVTEVSTSIGYENISYFNQLFKKMIGMTPGRYRDYSRWSGDSSKTYRIGDMTARELVVSAIEHRETQIVPWCIDFTIDLERRLLGQFGREWCDSVDNCIVTVDHPYWKFCDVPEDFTAVDPPSYIPEARGAGRGCSEFHDEVTEMGTGDRFVLVRLYGSMFEKAWHTRGYEQLLTDLVVNPSFAEALFDKIVEMDLAIMRLMLENPSLDGFLVGSDWGGQDRMLMHPETWRRILKPRYAKLFSLVLEKGKYLFLHSCGNISEIIPDLIDMGVQVLHPVQPECMDIRWLKTEYGRDVCFWGGISTQQALPNDTPHELVRELVETVGFMKKGGGYVLAPGQCIQSDVPLENVMTLIDFAKKQDSALEVGLH